MADDIASLVVKVDSKGVAKGSDRLDQLSDSAGKAEKSSSSLGGAFKKLASISKRLAIGVAAAATALVAFISTQAKAAREAQAYALALGVPIEQLTAMQHAASSVGIESDKMADILKDVAERIGDAFRNDAGEAKEVLESLNISIADMAKLSPDKQLLAIADGLSQVQTQGEKVQIMEALASDASLLLPLLEDNSSAMRGLMKEAIDSGKALTALEAKKLTGVARAWGQVSSALAGVGQTIAVELADPLARVLRTLSVWIPAAFNAITESLKEFQNSAATDEVARLNDKLKALRVTQENLLGRKDRKLNGLSREDLSDINEGLDDVGESIRDINKELAIWNLKVDEINDKKISLYISKDIGSEDPDRSAVDDLIKELQSEREAILMEYETREEMLRDHLAKKAISEEEFKQVMIESAADFQSKSTKITEDENAKKLSLEQDFQNKKNAMEKNAANLSVGFLQMLGREHKAAAIAGIVLSKAMAIAQVNVNAASARTAALTLYSLGPLGPAKVAAAQAHIAATQALSIGLIAATGLVQAASVTSGGGGSSSINASGSQLEPSLNQIEPDQIESSRSVTRFVIEGAGAHTDAMRKLLEDLIETKQDMGNIHEVVFS